jgi:Uma2 family endonuclease
MPSSPYRLTIEQYERMVDEGILHGRDRVHLIDGILVAKMTQNDPHCTADDLCDAALRRLIPPGWYIRGAKPIRLPGQNSKPEPDRCVVRGTILDYSRRSPGPADVGLVVEVADTSLYDDRAMAGLYGRAGIPVYWIINLVHRQVEVYSEPGPEGYGSRQDYHAGEAVPVVIDGQPLGQVAVDEILPPPPADPEAEGNGA